MTHRRVTALYVQSPVEVFPRGFDDIKKGDKGFLLGIVAATAAGAAVAAGTGVFSRFFLSYHVEYNPSNYKENNNKANYCRRRHFRHFLLFYALCIFSLDSAETVLIFRLISLSHHHVD